MHRRSAFVRNAFPVTLLLTLLLALLPGRWMGVTLDLANIANWPLTPIRDAAGKVAAWLRPPRHQIAEEIAQSSLEEVFQEKEIWRQRALEAELEVKSLQARLQEIELVPDALRAGAFRSVSATITNRNAGVRGGSVEVNRGQRHGVHDRAVAVFGGVHLVGWVRQANRLRSVLAPTTLKETGLIRAAVIPADADGRSATRAPAIQLEPVEDGTFIASAALDLAIQVGDLVVLDDETWLPGARALFLGVIESLEPLDEQPLRHRLVVRPRYRLQDLTMVTLIVQADEEPGATEEAGP
jgi:cell shape-determining protein MreC